MTNESDEKCSDSVLVTLLLLGVSIYLYASYEYRTIKRTEFQIRTTKDVPTQKIVFLSDLQFDQRKGETAFEEKMLSNVVAKVNEENADVVLLGGDYLNYPEHTDIIAKYLEQIKAKSYVIGILGNHDYPALHEYNLIEKFEAAGVVMLENETATLNKNKLSICGIEDLWFGEPSTGNCTETDDTFNILLSHNPDFFAEVSEVDVKAFDLGLSGHLHAGQITFFGLRAFSKILPSKYGERFRYGLKENEVIPVYITSGLGGTVFGQPIRFGAKPEIVVIALESGVVDEMKIHSFFN